MMPNPGTCDAWITVFAAIAGLVGFVMGLGVAGAVAWVCRT
jgi:hypothetical protein